MPEIVSNFCAAAPEVAVLFNWNLTTISRTVNRFSSAPLHRILSRTCWFVPIPYLYLETNKSQEVEQWYEHWHCFGKYYCVTSSRQSIEISLPLKKNSYHCQCSNFTKHQSLFLKIEFGISIARVVACLPKWASCCIQLLLKTRKHPVFMLASPKSLSCVRALPQELYHWLCILNIPSSLREFARWTACPPSQPPSTWMPLLVLAAFRSPEPRAFGPSIFRPAWLPILKPRQQLWFPAAFPCFRSVAAICQCTGLDQR